MQVVREWKRADGVTVRVTLWMRGGFGEVTWASTVEAKQPRCRTWILGSNWRNYMTRAEMQVMQRQFCEKLIEKEPG